MREGLQHLEELHVGFLSGLRVVRSDMWKPFLRVAAKLCASLINVVDPLHISKHLNEVVDAVQQAEQSRLRDKELRDRAKEGRFLLLRRGTKSLGHARVKLKTVLGSLGATFRTWEFNESFRSFWHYCHPTWVHA
jgi:transposase